MGIFHFFNSFKSFAFSIFNASVKIEKPQMSALTLSGETLRVKLNCNESKIK